MKKLPIGIQNFSKLIKENCVYVDKTALIHQMITQGSYYFLSRPRRFGKSLLVSTLAEIFSGNKDLFAGFAIELLPYDWQKYPVIHISFSGIPCENPQDLEIGIKNFLQDIAQPYEIILDDKLKSGEMLKSLVKQLAQQNAVVLLIDEYDYAILRHIHDKATASAIRETLKNFYSAIKDLDQYLKFVFLTGISKFPKTSIFSGLNNLEDISLDRTFNTLLGYTATEIVGNFEPRLIHSAERLECSMQELLEEIRVWYDGYQFTREQNAIKMYNPFSVLLFLKNSEFSNYWFATGTPTFLINLLKAKDYPVENFEAAEATESELGAFDINIMPLKTLLFQTGYLTIHSYNANTKNYLLGYPNKECAQSLIEYIFASMTQKSGSYLNNVVARLLAAFESYNYEQLHEVLVQLYATVPYTIQIGEEKYYQTIFYLVLKMIGADIIVEQPTNIGRIDAVIQTKDTCFIIEFKINATASVALEQIKIKKYYQPYQSSGKKIVLVGIAFNTTIKNVSEVEFVELN